MVKPTALRLVKPTGASLSTSAKAERKEAKELLANADELLRGIETSDFCKNLATKRQYPLFDASEIATGDVLGFGGFGVVFEVEEFILKDGPPGEQKNKAGLVEGGLEDVCAAGKEGDNEAGDQDHYEVSTARQLMAANVRRNGKDARYAIKCLHRDLSDLPRVRGMLDMVIEIKFLSRLWHPNIIKMRGYAKGPMLSPDFFFIMDRLYDTLDERIQQWKAELPADGGNDVLKKIFGCRGGAQKGKEEGHEIMLERLIVAYDLASAFSYMHENMLVYRDIKQENIGFDVRGDVKVFDFGLCKGLSPSLKARDERTGAPVYGYNLTPRTGSIPYIAPEVVEGKPYDSKCDVFSFAILLWEMFSLRRAFKGFTKYDYMVGVVRRKERMPLPWKMPPMIKLVVKEAWDHEPTKRPDMRRVAKMIRAVLNDMSEGDEAVLHRTKHMDNRSRHSMRSAAMTKEARKNNSSSLEI